MSDRGLTHVAFVVGNLEASIAFYSKYAQMEVVHSRKDSGSKVAWISDRTRPFVIVLIETSAALPGKSRLVRMVGSILPSFTHLGVACTSRQEVDELAELARRDGLLRKGPVDAGPPVGYFAFIADPDGNMLEVSFGQDVGLAVKSAS